MSSPQLGLDLSPGAGHPMPPANYRQTSRDAAARMAERAPSLQVRYLKALAAAGDRGLTDWEAQAGLSCSYTSIQPRRAELNDMEGRDWIEDSGIRRYGQSDVKVIAWTLTDRGREIVEAIRERGT